MRNVVVGFDVNARLRLSFRRFVAAARVDSDCVFLLDCVTKNWILPEF